MHHLPASKSLIAPAQPSALPTVPTGQLAPSRARPANANSKINRNVEAEYATLEAANKERHQAEEAERQKVKAGSRGGHELEVNSGAGGETPDNRDKYNPGNKKLNKREGVNTQKEAEEEADKDGNRGRGKGRRRQRKATGRRSPRVMLRRRVKR